MSRITFALVLILSTSGCIPSQFRQNALSAIGRTEESIFMSFGLPYKTFNVETGTFHEYLNCDASESVAMAAWGMPAAFGSTQQNCEKATFLMKDKVVADVSVIKFSR